MRQVGHLLSCAKQRRIQREQNVCEQDVIIGVLKRSLQTWHRRAFSSCAKPGSAVESQSVLSEGASAPASMALELPESWKRECEDEGPENPREVVESWEAFKGRMMVQMSSRDTATRRIRVARHANQPLT